jgi:hypothetical protein
VGGGLLVPGVSATTPPCPPGKRTECEPEIPAGPTGTLYFLRNKRRPDSNFIRAEITASGHFLYNVENTPRDGLGCPGTWLFEMAWAHFVSIGVHIQGVRGSWTFGTNLKIVNDLTKNNQKFLVDAAKHTWAFARASSKGFLSVQLIDSDGTPGNYTSVDVVFLP